MASNEPAAPLHQGGCHCGAVRFEVEAELAGVEVCNCSICTKKAYVHWYVPRERFRLLGEAPPLATYRFGTGRAQHHFCRECGVAPFYVARSDPDKIDVNVRCLDGMTLERLAALAPERFDGRDWEAAYRERRGPKGA